MAVSVELERIVAEIGLAVKNLTADADERRKEADERQKKADEHREEMNQIMKDLAESQKQTMTNLAESQEMVNKRVANSIEKLMETVEETSKKVREVMVGLSTFGHSIGALVEFIVIPKIRPQMREVGRNYDDIAPNRKIKVNESEIAEVDLFLHNTVEAMAVEVKTRLKEADIKEHVERLKALRRHENEAGIQDKDLYGAVVGVIIDDRARKRALESGLYVVEIIEEKDKLKIESPGIAKPW